MGNAAGGVHAAALGGLWQAVIFGFAGLRLREDGLVFEPHLPPRWRTLRVPLAWRGRHIRVTISADPLAIELQVEGERSLKVAPAGGPELAAVSGVRYRITRAGDGWVVRDFQGLSAADLQRHLVTIRGERGDPC